MVCVDRHTYDNGLSIEKNQIDDDGNAQANKDLICDFVRPSFKPVDD
jgi:hypothetical protein